MNLTMMKNTSTYLVRGLTLMEMSDSGHTNKQRVKNNICCTCTTLCRFSRENYLIRIGPICFPLSCHGWFVGVEILTMA